MLAQVQVPSVPLGLPSLPPLKVKVQDPQGTWLPGIERYLSHSWIDLSLITEGARKADNAGVPVDLWNFRTCQPLGVDHTCPSVTRRLNVLRRLFLDRLKLTAILDFNIYMSSKHQTAWKYWKHLYFLHRVCYPWMFADSIQSLRDCRLLWGL